MKRFVLAMTMIGVLCSAVSAGQIPSDGAPAPAPTGTQQIRTSTTLGEMPTVGAEQIFDAALAAMLTVVGLLR
ncbi:MAG TPA: hypothetical protein VGN90_17535 [Pyrinomonadaceae bacterium]|nr:hypothetical protein [Pyrinomonadaceae bacterium]